MFNLILTIRIERPTDKRLVAAIKKLTERLSDSSTLLGLDAKINEQVALKNSLIVQNNLLSWTKEKLAACLEAAELDQPVSLL
jgi:hypothetical protein